MDRKVRNTGNSFVVEYGDSSRKFSPRHAFDSSVKPSLSVLLSLVCYLRNSCKNSMLRL